MPANNSGFSIQKDSNGKAVFTNTIDLKTLESHLWEAEERLVAELELVEVGYLSRQTNLQARRVRAPHKLLADLMRQPSSRVRTALIALLLAHPTYAQAVPTALDRLDHEQAITLKFFYTAAVLLQRQYAAQLQVYYRENWQWLPDWYSAELNLPLGAPPEQLAALAQIHRQSTGVTLNWAGTYESAARNLIRRQEMEQRWKQ